MSPPEARAARMRHAAITSAIKYLKDKNPQNFAAAQVQAYDRGNAVSEGLSEAERRFGSPERLELALKILDVQAEAYLPLVEGNDMKSHECFAIFMNTCGEKAFENYAGFPLDRIAWMASEAEVQAIRKRAAHWVNEGYKRIAGVPRTDEKQEPQPQSTADAESGDETPRRERLLAEYKAATGDPSNRQIYSARNSGIHKPEFYKWLKGDLPGASETAKNFERFLCEKKSPIPRE
jgi:hypothetical protein